MSILIFSIPYLLSDDKYDTFVCLGLVLIASTLHIIAVIYIPLWFFLRVNVNKKIKKIYFILIGILIAISFYRPFFACVTTPFVQFLNSLGIRGTKYFKMRGHFGYLLPWAINFMELFIIVWADNLYKNINELSAFKYSHEYEKYQLRTKYIKLVKYVNYYLMIFLPLLQFNLSFYRITRNTLLLDFMACLMVIEDSKKVNLDVRKFIMAFTFSIIVLAVFGYGAIYSNVDVLEILKNNWIF